MKRRKALAQMGLSMGYVIAAPTFVGLLQSCKDEKTVAWIPKLLSESQGDLLKTIVDVVLPKTETPSASELNVHEFIDYFASECLEIVEQDEFKNTLDQIAQKGIAVSGKTEITRLTEEDLSPIIFAAVTEKDNAILPFAKKIRDLTIWGYKCNEYVGEQVLAYLPVPGEYLACKNLNDVTKGKAWSE